MALMKSQDIPKDAVIIDEIEAANYVWDLVTSWKSLSDTWALRYGPGTLGAVNAVSGFMINKFYRDKLKLRTYGYMSSVIPIVALPTFLTALFHRHVVSTGMLLMKNDTCPICYEIRSAAIQLSLGIAYPMVLAPVSSLMFANRYSTYRVPPLTEPKALFMFMKKLSKPFSNTLLFMGLFQFVVSSVVTYYEMRNNISLRRKVIELEKRLDEELHNK